MTIKTKSEARRQAAKFGRAVQWSIITILMNANGGNDTTASEQAAYENARTAGRYALFALKGGQ